MREASDFLVKLEAEIAQLKEHLEKLRAAKPIDQMTVTLFEGSHPLTSLRV